TPRAPRALLPGRARTARGRLRGTRAPRRRLRRLRAPRLGAHREPAGRGGGHLRHSLLLLDGDVERGGARRGGPPPAPAPLALRPLLPLRARRDRHPRRRLPRALHGGVPRLHAVRPRHPPLAGPSLSAMSRGARGWTELAAQGLLLLVGLGGLQVAAERTNRRFDLTPGRELSLAPVTRKLLEDVTAPLHIMVFFRRGTRERYADLVRLFADANPRIDFKLLDLDRFPERARSLGVSSYGRAAIEYASRRAVVLAAPEDELAGGIRRVVHGRPRRLVFTTGHGERAPGGGAEGYGRLAAALAVENYAVEVMSLVDGPVPDGADVLVVAGPRHDFLLPELDAVAAYLRAGGGVVMLLDPAPLPNLARLLASMGIRLGDDMIVDRERRVLGTDGLAAVVELFKRGNPVTDPEAGAIDTGAVLPSARTV